MAPRNFQLRSLSVGNGGSISSNALLSSSNPALKMNVSDYVRILPGGKISANWIDITAQSLSIDGSGVLSAAASGFLQGPGAGIGEICGLSTCSELKQ